MRADSHFFLFISFFSLHKGKVSAPLHQQIIKQKKGAAVREGEEKKDFLDFY